MSQSDFESAPRSLKIRQFKAGGKTLITTMVDHKKYHKKALSTLYKKRWQVELEIRNIKDTLGMNVLSYKSPDMVLKEIWVYLLAYNLLRLLMAQSAVNHDILPRQLSFKHCLQICLCLLSELASINDSFDCIMELIAQQQAGNRPGRIESRSIKRRPKPYTLLMKPRSEARENVQKNGHPRKFK